MKSFDKRLAKVDAELGARSLVLTLDDGTRHYLPPWTDLQLVMGMQREDRRGEPLSPELEQFIPTVAHCRPDPGLGSVLEFARQLARERLGLT